MPRIWIAALTALVMSAGPRPAEAAGLGTIKGRVVFEGTPPARPKLDRTSDDFCAAREALAEDLVVSKTGGIRDTLVRLPVGAATGKPPRKPVVLDQRGCTYTPHVVGLVAGQELVVKNSDRTLHNVHTYAGGETLFNLGQPAGGKEIRQDPEVAAGNVIRIACDVHAWMEAFAVVTDHPYFQVTGAEGNFTLKVPAGTYQLEAWHPKLGVMNAAVTVKAGKTTTATFTYK